MSFDLRKSVFADEMSSATSTPQSPANTLKDTGPLDLDELFDRAEVDPDLAHKKRKKGRLKVKTW